MLEVDLGQGVKYQVYGPKIGVCTVFPDISRPNLVHAERELTKDNIQQAREQGYTGTAEEAVWRSLVDHELLHTLLARELFNCESYVLRYEAGITRVDYAVRLYEESLVISCQHMLNKKVWPIPLQQWPMGDIQTVLDRCRSITPNFFVHGGK